MNVFISSAAFSGLSLEDMIELCVENEINLEFSSGIPHREDVLDYFRDYPYPKLAHNYFPAPKIPFVLNLASSNEDIRNTSVNHCLENLKLSKENNCDFFAAHAGFCVDPNPNELGKQIARREEAIDREKHWALFKKSLQTILDYASSIDSYFLIENNVLSQANYESLGGNMLFCCEDKECARILNEMNSERLGILLDTAHLKVSSNTLGFDLQESTKNILPLVKGVHHSDNDGISDSNQPLFNDYWFLEYMPQTKGLTHVLEVKNQSIDDVTRQIDLLVQSSQD